MRYQLLWQALSDHSDDSDKRFNEMVITPKKKEPKTKTKKTVAPEPITRKRRSSEEIMERLVTAAREEFKRSGYVGATTAVIARNAEVTEAQLFRYFDSKADLFREAVFEPLDKHFSEFNARYPAIAVNDENIREHARLYITELQQFLDEHSKLLLSLVVSQLFTSGGVQGTNGQGVGEIESLRHYFERGAATMSNRVETNAPVDPKLLVRVSFAAVLGCVLFKDWIFPKGLASEKDISSAIIDFVIDGISVNDPALQERSTTSKKKGVKK